MLFLLYFFYVPLQCLLTYQPRSLFFLNEADLLTALATEALLEQRNQQLLLTVYGNE